MNNKNRTFLGIDYGEKRVGIALANTPIAEPYKILPLTSATEDIKKICENKNITDVVVGVSEAQTKEATLAFVDDLKKSISLPIHLQDETLSSHQVKEHFLNTGMKKSKLHGNIDHYSATIILQDYLEDHPPFNL